MMHLSTSIQTKTAQEPTWETGADSQVGFGRLLSIVTLAVVVKAALLFVLLPHFQSYSAQAYGVERFPDGYDRIAWNLVQGNGYRVFPDTSRTMLRSPGYVLLLSLIFAVFGTSLLAVQVVNVVFSVVAAVLTQVLAREAGLSRTTSTIAALVFFFHPGVLVAESRGGPEIMLTLCLVASVLLTVVALVRQKWPSFAMAGVVNGLAMLVKSSVAPVLPVLFLYRTWKTPDKLMRSKIFAGMVICGFATVLIMAPWIVRNYRVSGEFIPTMTVGGLAAFQGAYFIQHLDSHRENVEIMEQAADEQVAIANAMGLKQKGRFFPQFPRVSDEVLFYRELGRRAMDGYKHDPRLILRGIVHNTWAFWAGGRTLKVELLNAIVALPFLGLSGIGLAVGIRKGLAVFQFFLITVAFIVPHLLILAMARYYIPIVPFVAILAAIPLSDWFERFTSHGRPANA